jgi:hypothetical protein
MVNMDEGSAKRADPWPIRYGGSADAAMAAICS